VDGRPAHGEPRLITCQKRITWERIGGHQMKTIDQQLVLVMQILQ